MRTNAQFETDFAHHTKGLDHISVGACPGCRDCGLESEWVVEEAIRNANEWNMENGSGYSVFLQEPTEADIDAANEGGFSWSQCDFCGSSLGGDRHAAHALLSGRIEHFSVCTDCLCYVANGDLPNEE